MELNIELFLLFGFIITAGFRDAPRILVVLTLLMPVFALTGLFGGGQESMIANLGDATIQYLATMFGSVATLAVLVIREALTRSAVRLPQGGSVQLTRFRENADI